MTYNSNSHITCVADVETFFHHLVTERKVSFHPDDLFEDYISFVDGGNTFTLDECTIYNRLMDESFSICERDEIDIYSIGLEELQEVLRINVE